MCDEVVHGAASLIDSCELRGLPSVVLFARTHHLHKTRVALLAVEFPTAAAAEDVQRRFGVAFPKITEHITGNL